MFSTFSALSAMEEVRPNRAKFTVGPETVEGERKRGRSITSDVKKVVGTHYF